MSLINLLPNSPLGLKGVTPNFKVMPAPPSSYHQTYSVDGKPSISVLGINPKHFMSMPSRLDEWDSSNTNKYKSRVVAGKTYMDNPPR